MEEFTPEESLDINQQEQEIELEDAIEKPNLSSIESKDPSLTDRLKIVYNKEVPMDLKLETKEGQKDIASFELIRVKVLSDSSSKETSPTCVKVELSSENDLLFHYTSIIDEGTFAKMKKLQNLKIEFSAAGRGRVRSAQGNPEERRDSGHHGYGERGDLRQGALPGTGRG